MFPFCIFLNLVSALSISAHFVRTGHLTVALVCLLVPTLFFRRRRSSLWGLQLFAYLAAIVWMHTGAQIIAMRLSVGQPWTKAAIILGVVSLLAILAGALLNHPALRARYPRSRG
ncbi:hypothetical protein [uncultured Propionivibrio sp.]|uniref:hypothetical protein n=1 Tax=uncultured Propionivibrio sp. TaxID=426737 RepID=UPI0029C08C03|nr:hypothetical protein [uncultured Propionivibrio sp.]